jgi:hypothetical protein
MNEELNVLQRRVRLLEGAVVGSLVVSGMVMVTAIRLTLLSVRERPTKSQLDELDVGRINVVERDRTGAALLRLTDKAGTPRVRLLVDSLGAARLEFLDATGRITRTIAGE